MTRSAIASATPETSVGIDVEIFEYLKSPSSHGVMLGMLIWFPSGWEEFAKWDKVEEAEVAVLVSRKLSRIKGALRHVSRNKEAFVEVDLGNGPGGRKYWVSVSFIGSSGDSHDLLQMLRVAPVTGTSIDIFAILNHGEIPAGETYEDTPNVMIGRMYDDGDRLNLRLIGLTETRRITEILFD